MTGIYHASRIDSTTVVGFDYASLDPGLASEARVIADRIRGRLNASIFDTGRDLTAIKEKMEHGAFGSWLRVEFNFTARTAQNYMNAVALLDCKSEIVSLLPTTVVYALAAPNAPAAVVDEVLTAAEAGNVMSPSLVKEKLATAIQAARHAAREAKKSPEQIKKDRKARESRVARQARQDAERLAQKAKEIAEEQERTARLTPLVLRIAAAIGEQDLAALNRAFSGNWLERSTMIRLLTELPARSE